MFLKNKTGPIDYLVAGLGNPGGRYAGTRHNVGFRAIDELAHRYAAKVDKSRFHALTGECAIGGARVLLIKPQTFMNLSGQAVKAAAAFYKIPPERIIVVFDDVSLPVGKLRIRKNGSAGGHNGIKSIIAECGTEEFPRLKIGVGDPGGRDLADWVLSIFEGEERDRIAHVLPVAADAVERMLKGDMDAAAGDFNGRTVE